MHFLNFLLSVQIFGNPDNWSSENWSFTALIPESFLFPSINLDIWQSWWQEFKKIEFYCFLFFFLFFISFRIFGDPHNWNSENWNFTVLISGSFYFLKSIRILGNADDWILEKWNFTIFISAIFFNLLFADISPDVWRFR